MGGSGMQSETGLRNISNKAVRLPLVLAAMVYLASASGRAVIDYDEGYYAQVAQQMIRRHDWVTPYAGGVRFLEKPPLMYWLTAGSFRVFGVNEFALRLPTALAVVALVWVVMRMARRGSGPGAEMIAGLCIAFSAGTYLFTRETLHDIWLVLFLSLAMHAFLEWYLAGNSLRHALLFSAALAGAVLCKSLIGVAFPLGIVVTFFLFSRQIPKWRTLHLFPGLLLFLGLAVPWHWLAAVRNQGFLRFFFVGEQFLRFLGRREPPVLWNVPLFTFWALILVWFFPWTAFLPAAFAAARKPADSGQRALIRLALAWIVLILAFYAVSERLEHYAFPVLPALSLLVGVALSRREETGAVRWAFRGLAALGVALFAAASGAGVWLFATGHRFGSATEASAGRVYQTDFSILATMPAPIVSNLLKPAAVTIAACAVGFLAALWFETRRRRMQAVMSVAAAMVIVCAMIHWSLVICQDLISSKRFALALAQEASPGDRLIIVGDYESANSINFYEPLHAEVFDGVAYALIPGMKYSDAPKIVLTREEFERIWRGRDRVFALGAKARLAELKPPGVTMVEVLARALVRNR
jgi:4-amino-4-deoxy-L-arabinose transferase-like glycosyltransferase